MTERKLVDADRMLGELARWWSSREAYGVAGPEPDPIAFGFPARDRMPSRIAGGKWDALVPPGTANPYWEIVRQLPLDRSLSWQEMPEPSLYWLYDHGREVDMFADRFDVCCTFSWAICSPRDIAWMTKVTGGRGVVEVGAGTGYWAWQLEQAGVTVDAYDLVRAGPGNNFALRTWTTVRPGDELASAQHPERVLFLSWPSYGGLWAARALEAYRGDTVIYCGEGEGGCCADDGFFTMLDEQWEETSMSSFHLSFWGIHDYLAAYTRR